MKHGPFQHLAPWPSAAVPVLSSTTLCAHMFVGASAASTSIGCVVANVKAVFGAASAAAVPHETACRRPHKKSCQFAGGSVSASMLSRHVYCVIYNGSML